MAKRMKFSVVGLPHYTIWHLYEPSADDLKHMERMEEERLAKEAAEKEEAERTKKMQESWKDPKEEWEKDKKDIADAAVKEKDEQNQALGGGEAGPHAHAGEEEAGAKVGLKAGGGGGGGDAALNEV